MASNNFLYNGAFGAAERLPYLILQISLSNQIVDVIRIYPTVVNLFQKIGGVSQIFLFVFVYFMMYNNEIIIDLYLLNFGVLMIPQEDSDDKKKISQNHVADIRMKKAERSSTKDQIPPYTYWELLRFKSCACCNKKLPRYGQYRKHKEIIEERMDIVNFISNEGYASLLGKLLMKPYQLKMTSHLKTQFK